MWYVLFGTRIRRLRARLCSNGQKLILAMFKRTKIAFDSLDHCILLQRIGDLGVTGSVLRWFKN